MKHTLNRPVAVQDGKLREVNLRHQLTNFWPLKLRSVFWSNRERARGSIAQIASTDDGRLKRWHKPPVRAPPASTFEIS